MRFVEESLTEPLLATGAGRRVVPRYGSYCFSELPSVIEALLLGREGSSPIVRRIREEFGSGPKRIALVLFDAFGWCFHERFASMSRALSGDGICFKLTSQFPSTTSAHLTALHFGLPVSTTGIFEWYYYEPLAGGIISPLPFMPLGSRDHDTLERSGVSTAEVFPFDSFYERLATHGVRSAVLESDKYAHGLFSRRAMRGADIVPFSNVTNGFRSLRAALADPAIHYTMTYVDTIDTASHRFGPGSGAVEREIESCLRDLDGAVEAGSSGDTLLLVTADHGQIAIEPETTLVLDRLFPWLPERIRTGPTGELLVPGGSARDFFLYLRDECVEDSIPELREGLSGRATVLPTAELVELGFFGPAPSRRLFERLSSVVILPHANESVWWSGGGRFRQTFKGHHGGWSPEEMEIPLAVIPVPSLR